MNSHFLMLQQYLKKKNIRKIFILLFLLTALSFYFQAWSQIMPTEPHSADYQEGIDEKNGEILKIMDSISGVKAITIFVVHPYMLFNKNLHESNILEMGCIFSTTDANDISDMKSILQRANVKSGIVDEMKINARGVIYFLLENNVKIKLLFSPSMLGSKTIDGILGEHPIVAEASFPWHIYEWAEKIKYHETCSYIDYILQFKSELQIFD